MTDPNDTTLRLRGALDIVRITGFTLHVDVNEHGHATLEGEAGDNALEQICRPLAGREMALLSIDDDGVESGENCDLGWHTTFKGHDLLIMEKWAKLERGELRFTYRLGRPGLGWGRPIYNERIRGMSLLGEVLATERETLKLRLDIDEGRDPGGPYAYDWRPETGNMMYCMPQVGTRVSLYFPDHDEQHAMAVNCVRTNGGSCDRMSDPSKRAFVTEHGKELTLYPDSMSLSGAGGHISLVDGKRLDIISEHGITIVGRSVEFKAPTVTVLTPNGEISLAKLDPLQGTITASFLISNQYDLLSMGFTQVDGWNRLQYPAYDDAPQEGHFEWGKLACNVLAGLAVVAVVAVVAAAAVFVVATVAVAAAPALATAVVAADVASAALTGGLVMGAMEVGSKAYADFMSGNVSDTSSYIAAGARGAAVGAVSGAVGQCFQGWAAGSKLLASLGGKQKYLSAVLKRVAIGTGGVVENIIENRMMGRKGSWLEYGCSFALSIVFYDVGEKLVGPLLSKARQADNIVGSAIRKFENAATDMAKHVDDFWNAIDDKLDNIGHALNGQLDNLSHALNRNGRELALLGPPDDFLRGATNHLDDAAENVSKAVAKNANEVGQNIAEQAGDALDGAANKVAREGENYTSFRDLMSPEDVARYDEYWYNVGTQKAVEARDAVLAEMQTWSMSKRRDIIAVTGGVNLRTGEVTVGIKSHKRHGSVRVDGSYICAEDLVVQQLGGDITDIVMTSTIRPRNMDEIKVCLKCQAKYPYSTFMPDVKFDSELIKYFLKGVEHK